MDLTPARSRSGLLRPRSGFTLIELLVVISILALLIGILLPVLSSARESGRQTVCLSNQRSNGVALQMYADDFKGTLPAGWDEDITIQERSFRERLNPYLSNTYLSSGSAANDVTTRVREHWRCPSIPDHATVIDFGQYGANPNLMPFVRESTGGINPVLFDARFPENTYITQTTIDNPSQTVTFCEFKWRNERPWSYARQTATVTNLAPGTPYRLQFPHARSDPMNTTDTGDALAFDVPAGGSAGTGYADGRAALTKIEDYPDVSPVSYNTATANAYLTWITDD